MTTTSSAGLLDEAELIEDVSAAWDMMRANAKSRAFVVFVAEDGARVCASGGSKHKRYLLQYGHGEVGTYNRLVEFGALLDDVFHVARQQGLIQ